jgi:hypothetical protein
MEHFFSLTSRLQSRWEDSMQYTPDDPFEHHEVELSVPVEEFLITRWDWDDLYAFADTEVIDKILWMTEDMFLLIGKRGISENMTEDTGFGILLHADFTIASGGEEQMLTLYNHRRNSAISSGACSVFWRAIETSNSKTMRIESRVPRDRSFPSGPILSQFLRASLLLKRVDFQEFRFWEEHCRAFATIQRTDLEITFSECTLEPRNAEVPFIEWFRHNQIVTTLDNCGMGSRVLQALSGNNSVKRLSFIMGQRTEERSHALIRALATNQGIINLCVSRVDMDEETCRLLFQALSTHPRIKYLTIRNRHSYSAERKSTMMHAIFQMLHLNTVLIAINLPEDFDDEEVNELPRLEMNRSCFEVQRQAVKRADPSIRPQLLGRALHVVRYNSDLVFRFLSENVPAFVRTEGEEEEEEEDSTIPLVKDPNLVSGQKRKAST